MRMSTLAQRLGLAALNSGLLTAFAGMIPGVQRLAYTLKFARWYRDNDLQSLLLPTAEPFGRQNRYGLYERVVVSQDLADQPIDYLEFGVADGDSLRWWVQRNRHPESTFTGFDTFTGLPENWGEMPQGTFSTGGSPPAIGDSRCQFQIGLFQDTLLAFLAKNRLGSRRTVVHIDCDLYSATLYVLVQLYAHLKSRDVLLFDEFADVTHEFRAYEDFLAACGPTLRVLGAANGGHKLALEVVSTS